MGLSGVWELQKAIFSILDGDGTLSGLVSGVYDHVAENTDFPYVSIGECVAGDWSFVTTSGLSAAVAIHVWSRGGGRKESLNILARVYDLLHEAAPSVEGYAVIMFRFASSEVLLETDGITYHGIINFKVLLEEN